MIKALMNELSSDIEKHNYKYSADITHNTITIVFGFTTLLWKANLLKKYMKYKSRQTRCVVYICMCSVGHSCLDMFLNPIETHNLHFSVTSSNCGQKETLDTRPTSEVFDVKTPSPEESVVAAFFYIHSGTVNSLLWIDPPSLVTHPCASSGVNMFHQSVISLHWSHI